MVLSALSCRAEGGRGPDAIIGVSSSSSLTTSKMESLMNLSSKTPIQGPSLAIVLGLAKTPLEVVLGRRQARPSPSGEAGTEALIVVRKTSHQESPTWRHCAGILANANLMF